MNLSKIGIIGYKPLPTAVRVPLVDKQALPPLGPLRDAYLAHLCGQLAESAASRLADARPQFKHTGLAKRIGALHAASDHVLVSLFGHFDAEAADTLNHLTRTAETALASLVLLAVQADTSDETLTRVSELLAELATLAGLPNQD